MVPLVRRVMLCVRRVPACSAANTHSAGQAGQPVRADDRDHPQGQGSQADRVRQMVKLQEAGRTKSSSTTRSMTAGPAIAICWFPRSTRTSPLFARPPHLLAADAGFYSSKNEKAAKRKGVQRVCIPNRSTKSAKRKREQKKPWFRNGQKWRTRMRGPHQRRQTTPRSQSLSIQRRRRYEALGRPRCHR